MRAAQAMSPILLGLAVMCWRVRRRPVSSANPRSPRQRFGLQTLKAATTHDNIASQKVLAKNRFVPIGLAGLSGKPGSGYERDLSAG
jgi:[ribosomal protein S5]-alanine N-acetyltransferase